METDLVELRGLLRRMIANCPELRRVGSDTADPGILAEAAGLEGLLTDHREPEGWIIWAPGQDLAAPMVPGSSLRVVVAVARSVESIPMPMVACRPARGMTTLREWVSRWKLARVLLPLMKSPAVGDRLCKCPLPDSSEYVFSAGGCRAGESDGHCRNQALVTAFGVGHFPIMPATLVCALMVPPALLLHFFLGPASFVAASFVVALAATVGCVMLERWSARWFLADDPREFVLDEVAGQALAWSLVGVAAPWWAIPLGFFLFRIFDIFKWGISWVEGLRVRGTIVWDDLLAGLYAGLITLWICSLFPTR
ncbi:MAG: hypothetical protein Fur0032_11930 [Terrimicrobiaceae bacterium]